ncbi:Flp family type IVb pilin [Vreelandella sp. TE19]
MKVFVSLYTYLTTLHNDKKGASAIEYALIAGLIAAGLITVLTLLGGGIADFFQQITDGLGLKAPETTPETGTGG